MNPDRGGNALQLVPIRCFECHDLEPDKDECVECMGTGRDLTDAEWGQLHDEFMEALA